MSSALRQGVFEAVPGAPAPGPAPAELPPSPLSASPGFPSPAPAPAAPPPPPSPVDCFTQEEIDRLSPTRSQVCCTRLSVYSNCVSECQDGCCDVFADTPCYAGSYFGGVCSSWGICSWVAIILAVIALLLLSVCCVSTMMTRTRQRRRMWDEQLRRQALRERRATQGLRGQAGGIGDVELANIVSMDEEGLAQLAVRKALPQPGQPPRECAICLDVKPVDEDAWVAFPCTHGCCQPCFADLLRHNPCIQRERHLVQCPFCRKVATAIIGPSREELTVGQQPGTGPEPSPTPPT